MQIVNDTLKDRKAGATNAPPFLTKSIFKRGENRMANPTVSKLEQRFWAKVALTANPNRCWLWSAGLDGHGYGQIKVKGKHRRAHRLAWFFVKGEYPTLFLLHSCPGGDNPLCVNPNHLREGTAKDNSEDAVKRGQMPLGEQRTGAKLTNEQVAEIKRRLATGESGARIARAFGVGHSTVQLIRVGRNWKHIRPADPIVTTEQVVKRESLSLKTHCQYGHELVGENVRWRYDKRRGKNSKECRECLNRRQREYNARQK